MTENSSDLPAAPGTTAAHDTPYATADAHPQTTTKRDWRRLGRSRKVLTAGAVVAGLAIGGAGFGAGYAVGDDGTATGTTTQQTGTGFDQHGFPGGPGGDRDGDGQGPLGGPPGSDQGGTTGQSPDFNGDGVPDGDTASGTTSDSSTQQS